MNKIESPVLNEIRFKLAAGATLPTRATEQSAGLDLYSPISFTIPPCKLTGRVVDIGRFQIDTGVAVELPVGYRADVLPRSGLAFKQGVTGHPGLIDSDYRQSIGVLLYNFTSRPIDIEAGDRIAQLVISQVSLFAPIAVDELEPSNRGGFGSTGK